MATDENARELTKRIEKLFERKKNIDNLNQELAYNYYPWRADFTGQQPLGREYCEELFDSAPVLACRDLSNARASMLRPRGQQWFEVSIEDEDLAKYPPVAQKLDFINTRMRKTLYHRKSGFVDVMRQNDHDLVTFGNAVHSCEASYDDNGIRRPLYQTWHLRDCVWLDDNDGVTQDFLARKFKASARHIKAKFPDADLHSAIESAIEDDPDKEFLLCHVMMLADEYDYYEKPKAKHRWASIYYDHDHKCLLRENTLPRFPYRVSRWEKIGNSQYAISPAALTALADARGIQGVMQVLYEASEKALDPPVKVTDGAVIGEVNMYGGGITHVKADYDEKLGPAIELLAPRTNPPSGIEIKLMLAQALRDEFYISKLVLPPADNARTATEVQRLHEDFIRANIPLFEPWEADTEGTLDLSLEVQLDIGTFGDPRDPRQWPEELSRVELDWQLSNPLQDAIERNKVNQATTTLGLIAAARQADPMMRMPANMEMMVQDAMRGAGDPAEWLVDLKQLEAEAAAMQQQGNIIGALQQADQAANIIKTGTEAAANVNDIRQQPALDSSFAYGPA